MLNAAAPFKASVVKLEGRKFEPAKYLSGCNTIYLSSVPTSFLTAF